MATYISDDPDILLPVCLIGSSNNLANTFPQGNPLGSHLNLIISTPQSSGMENDIQQSRIIGTIITVMIATIVVCAVLIPMVIESNTVREPVEISNDVSLPLGEWDGTYSEIDYLTTAKARLRTTAGSQAYNMDADGIVFASNHILIVLNHDSTHPYDQYTARYIGTDGVSTGKVFGSIVIKPVSESGEITRIEIRCTEYTGSTPGDVTVLECPVTETMFHYEPTGEYTSTYTPKVKDVTDIRGGGNLASTFGYCITIVDGVPRLDGIPPAIQSVLQVSVDWHKGEAVQETDVSTYAPQMTIHGDDEAPMICVVPMKVTGIKEYQDKSSSGVLLAVIPVFVILGIVMLIVRKMILNGDGDSLDYSYGER